MSGVCLRIQAERVLFVVHQQNCRLEVLEFITIRISIEYMNCWSGAPATHLAKLHLRFCDRWQTLGTQPLGNHTGKWVVYDAQARTVQIERHTYSVHFSMYIYIYITYGAKRYVCTVCDVMFLYIFV